ncbi:MAG: hypothetical protein HYT87_12380 [Nitrospirae bacterium]|nr:hypothetical protein [Nitrospirota bacterium]
MSRRILAAAVALMTIGYTVESALAKPIPRTYRSARVLSMGGAHTAIADDDATLFMNPAGLAQTRSFDFPFLLELETNMATVETGLGAADIATGGTDEQLENVANLVDDRFGDSIGITTRLFPNIIVGGFGFGLLVDIPIAVQIANPTLTEARLGTTPQVGMALGYGLSFLEEESLRVGLVAKGMLRAALQANGRVNRLIALTGEGEKTCDFLAEDVLPGSLCPDAQGGVAANVDVGTLYSLPSSMGDQVAKLKPTFALVARDIPVWDLPGSNFADALNLTLSSEETPVIPWSIGLGASISPWLVPWDEDSTGSRYIRTKVGLDIEDVTLHTTDDGDLLKRTHLGAEFQFGPFFKQRKKFFRSDTKVKEVPFFSLEAGLNQLQWTAGFNLNIWKLLQIGAATYGEELGSTVGDQVDRRFVVRIAL